jgi:hypothetical protein
MMLVLMLTSKGMAGVPRASLVVIAATLAQFNIPEAGLLLLLGIDHFLDMARSATNVIGNGIATAVVAKWEGDLEETVPHKDVATRRCAKIGHTAYEAFQRWEAFFFIKKDGRQRMKQLYAAGLLLALTGARPPPKRSIAAACST